jgi:hypothetical protein
VTGPSPELSRLLLDLAAASALPAPSTEAPRRLDWGRWWALVEEHQLAPLLGRDPPGAAPRALRRALVRARAVAAHEAFARTAELHRLVVALSAVAPPVLLKGAALAVTLHRDAADRPMSDVDLLLPDRAAVDRAVTTLRGLGYQARPGPPGHHHAPPMVHRARGLTVELHHDLVTPGLGPSAIRSLLARSRPVAGALRALDPADALLHHAAHALGDPVDAPLLRNLHEVAWLAWTLPPGDRAALPSRAAEWGPLPVAALDLAARLFGSPALLGPARAGPHAGWAMRRLRWTGPVDGRPAPERWLRRLAVDHLARVGRSRWPLVGALAAGVGGALRTRLAAPTGLVAPPLEVAAVGASVLVHDLGSGAAHVVEPAILGVLELARRPAPPARLAARVAALGPGLAAARRLVATLRAEGLLVEAAPETLSGFTSDDG